jgi:hypothetical protein
MHDALIIHVLYETDKDALTDEEIEHAIAQIPEEDQKDIIARWEEHR